MPVCPDCLSRKMIRYGKFDNQQRWHCKKCNLTTIYPRLRRPRKKKVEQIEGIQEIANG